MTRKRAKSPYAKYNKFPYRYRFSNCRHPNRVRESLVVEFPNSTRRRYEFNTCTSCGNFIRLNNDHRV